MVDILCQYPESVVAEVLNVTIGLPIKYDYLPPLSKFKEALDSVIAARSVAARRDQQIMEQLKERLAIQQFNAAPRASYEELMSKVPDHLRVGRSVKNGKMTEKEFLDKFPHITKEQLDAIPNADGMKPLYAKPEDPNPFD